MNIRRVSKKYTLTIFGVDHTMSKTVGILDLGISNLKSIINSVKMVGSNYEIISGPGISSQVDQLIIPGVGTFGAAAERLADSGLFNEIISFANSGQPILGICLGMQLLCSRGTEFGVHKGLDLISGDVEPLNAKELQIRVPNMGWHEVHSNNSTLLPSEPQFFYHLHSFVTKPNNPDTVAGYIEINSNKVTVALEQENVFGVQFHPEKSQDAGLDLINRFCKL